MLEESTMDKKPAIRSSQQSCKSTTADSRFKQDGATKFAKTSRRREGSYPRSETSRKPNPQKNKTINDKRPRPRGSVSFDKEGGEQVVVDDLLDAGVTLKTGSKKVNLNHLLNFTFAKREFNSDNYRGTHFGRIKSPKYNKEQFLQANCQFIVSEGGNYSIHIIDPDVLVDWAFVEQVLLPCHEVPSCPICLYPATAAKITRCGHVFCWICILHYLALSERSWHKCPICYDSIHKSDLKSVVSLAKRAPKIGEKITLSLVRREKGSLFAIPVNKWKSCPTDPLCLSDDSETTCFQKLLMATKEETLAIIERETLELKTQLENEENNPDTCFVESALECLKERKELMNNAWHNPNKTLNTKIEDENENTIAKDNLKEDNYALEKSNAESLFPVANNELEDLEIENELFEPEYLTENEHLPHLEQKNQYYFYQASDGQHIYMNSLNIRMLIEEYGGLENCPISITAEIVDLEGATMTESLRKRTRYLQHLPLTCQFQMVELHFEDPLVSPATLSLFKPEVEKRRRTRTRKAREERRRERHIELEENKKIGKFPSARYKLDSMQHFPTYKSISTDEDPPLVPEASPSPSPDILDPGVEEASFAQMLRTGKARPSNAPIWGTLKEPVAVTSVGAAAANSDEDAPAPEYSVSFGDAIQEAINSMSLRSETQDEKGKRSKRKKNKNTLLFTTTMNRSK